MSLYLSDCIKKMREMKPNSISACVTDPPYGLSFMNKKWDYDVPSIEVWKEVLRVLKPGGHLLSFGGTRTYHRMACNIEDAGFEIRDQVQWIYGSGFPKSLNISKAIDKAAGAEKTYQAMEWDGWGTALKPAHEPIVMARKPLSEKTVVKNVLKWGTGGINVDGCRVGFQSEKDKKSATFGTQPKITSKGVGGEGGTFQGYRQGVNAKNIEANPYGRFPANLLLDECAAGCLDRQSGVLKQGGASRFFYCAKASKAERNDGLGNPAQTTSDGRNKSIDNPFQRGKTLRQNHHPTVKPIKLMKYLVTLVTPTGGKVLDPFMGSGSTGVACKDLGFEFIGIERDPEYFKIAEQRMVDNCAKPKQEFSREKNQQR